MVNRTTMCSRIKRRNLLFFLKRETTQLQKNTHKKRKKYTHPERRTKKERNVQTNRK